MKVVWESAAESNEKGIEYTICLEALDNSVADMCEEPLVTVTGQTEVSYSVSSLIKMHERNIFIRAYNGMGSIDSPSHLIDADVINNMVGFIKPSFSPSDNDKFDFGHSVDISEDGKTLAISAPGDWSYAVGVNGAADNDQAPGSGAVYIYNKNNDDEWSQSAYIKAHNTDQDDRFGIAISLSDDGKTLAVGADGEASAEKGLAGSGNDNSASGSGAVYIFELDTSGWQQTQYVKASNSGADDYFGRTLALSGDGNSLLVGAIAEDSSGQGTGSLGDDNIASNSGAAYLFKKTDGGNWVQQTLIKSSNSDAGDWFASDLDISYDGTTIAVGAQKEASPHKGINGGGAQNNTLEAGAVYIFQYLNGSWIETGFIKGNDNAHHFENFGKHLSLSGDGSRLAIADKLAIHLLEFDGANWDYSQDVDEGKDFPYGYYIKSGVSALEYSRDGNELAIANKSVNNKIFTGITDELHDTNITKANCGLVSVLRHNGTIWAANASPDGGI
ncbi:hypothetical protein [Vibrio paucivorans]